MASPIRRPSDVPDEWPEVLIEHWHAARKRSLLARYEDRTSPQPDDLFAEFVFGAKLAFQVTASRWCVVTELLKLGAVDSWSQIGAAIGVDETSARDEFHAWIASQAALRRDTGSIGLTKADAEELYAV